MTEAQKEYIGRHRDMDAGELAKATGLSVKQVEAAVKKLPPAEAFVTHAGSFAQTDASSRAGDEAPKATADRRFVCDKSKPCR